MSIQIIAFIFDSASDSQAAPVPASRSGGSAGDNTLRRDPEYAARFLNEFRGKLMFGTDICSARYNCCH